jgi:hypothetical protein
LRQSSQPCTLERGINKFLFSLEPFSLSVNITGGLDKVKIAQNDAANENNPVSLHDEFSLVTENKIAQELT